MNLHKNKYCLLLQITVTLILLGCDRNDRKVTRTDVDPVLSAEMNLRAVARDLSTVDYQEIKKSKTIVELHSLIYNEESVKSFAAGDGWIYREYKMVHPAAFDYLVFPNSNDLAFDRAILLAVPRAIDGIRIVLTHELKVVQISASEFYEIIEEQMR